MRNVVTRGPGVQGLAGSFQPDPLQEDCGSASSRDMMPCSVWTTKRGDNTPQQSTKKLFSRDGAKESSGRQGQGMASCRATPEEDDNGISRIVASTMTFDLRGHCAHFHFPIHFPFGVNPSFPYPSSFPMSLCVRPPPLSERPAALAGVGPWRRGHILCEVN
ncbi:hypothetical protein LZ31DRAFT_29963 [Colletotrichum somersetense]|nr:hypothetical protein LZ31DRAFT_29963 [Colletotrichum somersetense]